MRSSPMSKSIPQRQPSAGSESDQLSPARAQPVGRALPAARKVPEITIYFWIIKLLTTAMGEVTSDYVVHQITPEIAVALGGIGLGITLFLQFSTKKYVAWIYWSTVTMVAVFGTMVADVLHI